MPDNDSAGVREARTIWKVESRRAENLVHVGELSSARQALEGVAVALGTQATLNKLKDVRRRPPQAREALPPEIMGFQPQTFVPVGRETVRQKPSFSPQRCSRGDLLE